jgi:hypothetical protein
MVLFEVFLSPGQGNAPLLSDEVVGATKAQVMTLAEARRVGFQGLPDPPPGKEVRLIAVAKRDASWVHRALEASPVVASFRMHDVD